MSVTEFIILQQLIYFFFSSNYYYYYYFFNDVGHTWIAMSQLNDAAQALKIGLKVS